MNRPAVEATGPRWLVAPAKLTISLKVLGRRSDGYHDIESEMVSIDLFDRLLVDPAGSGLDVVATDGTRAGDLTEGADNLVTRALEAAGCTAGVRLEKHIPVGGGLGGGSADAAAILRWAGCTDPALAARLGADVPFCVVGGRAMARGIGELVTPLPFEPRAFVLLVPPCAVNTGEAYRIWDSLAGSVGPPSTADPEGRNDLTAAALLAEPRLAEWGAVLADATGQPPVLAGSGSTWWVEGTPEKLGVAGKRSLVLGREEGRLVPVRTVPAGWSGPPADGVGAPER